jgi:hypothetical protein
VKESRSNCGEVDAYRSALPRAADDERLITPAEDSALSSPVF